MLEVSTLAFTGWLMKEVVSGKFFLKEPSKSCRASDSELKLWSLSCRHRLSLRDLRRIGSSLMQERPKIMV